MKIQDLCEMALRRGIMDRLSYADAVGHDSEEGVSTKALTSKMRELIGKPVKTLGDDENETLRLAFIFAEMWFDSLADANHNKGLRPSGQGLPIESCMSIELSVGD